MAERVDLDAAERVINRPHVIDLREDGWTIMHPPACHPDLFACPVNRTAGRALEEPPPLAPGRYFCEHDPDGVDWGLVIGPPADDSEGIDWTALVAELRVAREEIAASRVLLDDYSYSATEADAERYTNARAAYDRARRPVHPRPSRVPTMTRAPDGEVLLRTREVAAILNVPHRTVARWLRDGKLRGGRLPSGRWRVPRSEVDRALAEILPPDRSEEVG